MFFASCRRVACALVLAGVTTDLAAQAGAVQATPQPSPETYDPDAGIDANGRIEKPQLPDDLPNPERWRYTPEGRLKPGNPIDRFLISSFISPIFFREEDIGFGGGIALTDVDFRNQRGREFANMVFSYSQEGQQHFEIDWARWLHHRELPGGGIIREERSRINAHAQYSRTLTRRFFGFGSRTPKDDETSYTEELALVSFGLRKSVPNPGDDLLLSLGASLAHHGLSRGRVSAVPTTDVMFPEPFRAGDGVDQLWLDGGISYDTRDSLHQPYRGFRLGLEGSVVPLQTGGEVGGKIGADASVVFPVPPLLHHGGDADEVNPPTDVVALGGFVAAAAGDLPFYDLPSLGGASTLRGYIQNRFTDRTAAHGSAEYRFAVVPRGIRFTRTIRIERIGLGLFYDFGTVANRLGNLGHARYHDSYGVGLRVAFSREALFRIDFGISREDANLTIAFGNSF